MKFGDAREDREIFVLATARAGTFGDAGGDDAVDVVVASRVGVQEDQAAAAVKESIWLLGRMVVMEVAIETSS